MNFWEKIQQDLKKNIQEGLEIFKEGSSVVTEKIEKLTEEGKKKYKIFNLNMKVQEEFTKLGGEVYDLISKKSKNPLGSRKVRSIVSTVNRLETQINRLEDNEGTRPRKTTARQTVRKSTKKTRSATSVKRRAKSKTRNLK